MQNKEFFKIKKYKKVATIRSSPQAFFDKER